MNTALELASVEELLLELKKRYLALIVLGVHAEDFETITEVVDGPMFMCAGLMAQASCELTATMTRPLGDDED